MTVVPSRRRLRAGLLLLLIPLVLVGVARPAAAADRVRFAVTVDGHPVADGTAGSPLRLHDDEDTPASITVTNGGTDPIVVRTVRLDGSVAGLVFFGFLARIDLTVPPGQTVTRAFTLDLGGLAGQAVGRLPARVQLIGPDDGVIAQRGFHVDVDGRLTSTYGLFGIVIALITVALLAAAVVRLVSGRLSDNRWYRAVRFAVCGIGVGLTLSYTASILGLLTPTPGSAAVFVALGIAAGLAFGYLTPTPGGTLEDDDRDPLDEALLPA